MSVAITLQELKDYLNVTDTSYDTVLQSIIDSVEAQLASKYGIAFTITSVIGGVYSYHKQYDNYEMELDKKPIVSITSLKINDAEPDSEPNWVTLTERTPTTDGDYTIDTDTGIVYFIDRDYGYDDYQNIMVTFDYGFDQTAIPDEIKQLVLLMSAQQAITGRSSSSIYTSQDSVRIGEIAVSKGGSALPVSQQSLQNSINDILIGLKWITPVAGVMV